MTVTPWMPEVGALARAVGVAARGRAAALAAVSVSLPPELDASAFVSAFLAHLRAMGVVDVAVATHRADGPASILSLEFHR